jgi:pSer/pThr/pTyr-binding forkhead associated (FHA) protein
MGGPGDRSPGGFCCCHLPRRRLIANFKVTEFRNVEVGADSKEANMGRDKKTSARTEPRLPARAPRIHLAAPADQPTVRVEISKAVTLIGSRRDCDLFIGLDDVSKVHCALVNTGSALIATDLCSRCGTFINGQRVAAATLHPGDELSVGSVRVAAQFLDVPNDWAAAGDHEDDVDLVLAAPLRLTAAAQQHELTTLPAVIGRRHACQVLLDTPDVSLAHALLFTVEGCPAVFDLGSRSGTFLNGDRVMLSWLRDGDRLCIGGEELTVAWAGPQAVMSKATSVQTVGAAHPTKAPRGADQRGSDDSAELGLTAAKKKKEVGASPAALRARAAGFDEREARLEAQSAALEAERARLAAEKQRLERQAAELRAAAAQLDQDRAWFDAQRTQFDRERAQLEAERAEVQQRLAEHEKTLRGLRQREAALAEAEQEIVKRQAELAKREAANVEAVRRIEQFREALGDAQRMFTSAAVTSRQAGRRRRSETPTQRAGASDSEPGPEAEGLPAPLVDEPLFAGLDPRAPEQWPPELQERLRFLSRQSGKSNADVVSQVLAEHRARQLRERRPSGN